MSYLHTIKTKINYMYMNLIPGVPSLIASPQDWGDFEPQLGLKPVSDYDKAIVVKDNHRVYRDVSEPAELKIHVETDELSSYEIH